MQTKKQQIIFAFENLDATMLDVLLNDGQPYQDVPKDLFVEELQMYFELIKSDNYSKLDYKAYKGTCQNCNKGKTGYAFVNSEGHSFMSMVFEESDDDFTDIYKCGSFFTEEEIIEEMTGIYFYKDDEVKYIPTAKNILDEKRCDDAFRELTMEIENEGILSKNFYIPWVVKYEDMDDISQAFTGEIYRYQSKIIPALSILKYIAKDVALENLAKKYWIEFISFPKIDFDCIQDWLIRCDQDLQFLKYGMGQNANFEVGYFEQGGLRIDLKELYYYHNIGVILQKYFDWIPEESSVSNEVSELSNDFEMPF